jgi:tetratricopeptide (TPR) repeat protein
MYTIIPSVLILLCSTVIAVIIIKKFPVIANLNLEEMPAEKESRFKDRIIKSRLKRNFFQVGSTVKDKAGSLTKEAGNFFKSVYKKLEEIEGQYENQLALKNLAKEEKIKLLFREAEEHEKKEELKEAEKKIIAIISLDHNNINAYEFLVRIYNQDEKYSEAIETLEYVLKLIHSGKALEYLEEDKKNPAAYEAEIFFDLASAYDEVGKIKSVLENLKQALKIDEKNPRFLDMMITTAIMVKDKILALDAYNRLSLANPENNKLEEWKKQIGEL